MGDEGREIVGVGDLGGGDVDLGGGDGDLGVEIQPLGGGDGNLGG